MKTIKQLALIGSTASGKTSLSIKIAKQMNAYILSIDSLSIYKEISIVSAKPSIEEREGIKHFGLDYIYPNEMFDVTTFIKLYHQVYSQCIQDNKNLVIVGGTSFYLKMLIDGISKLPIIHIETRKKSQIHLQKLQKTHDWLYSLDPMYMSNIEKTDAYRIEKVLHIYLETKLTPSEYFSKFPPKPSITAPLPIYQIVWDKDILRKRIALRTSIMLNSGLINEVCSLEKQYTRKPHCMKSIGIKETLAYLDGIYDKNMLREKINTNTVGLAKRQSTFNNSQFKNIISAELIDLEKIVFRQF